jgi:hypothetical protein
MLRHYTAKGHNLFLCLSPNSSVTVVITQRAERIKNFGCHLRQTSDSSPHQTLRTGSCAHTAFYWMGTGDLFPGNKAAGTWSWLVVPSNAKQLYLHCPQYALMTCAGTIFTSISLPVLSNPLSHYDSTLYCLTNQLIGPTSVKKLPTVYGNRRFISAFPGARHLSQSWARSIHSIPPLYNIHSSEVIRISKTLVISV